MAYNAPMKLETLTLRPERPNGAPPLLFIHGSFCGAWIWAEHFMPYFAAHGWECHALSLRGHGESSGNESLPWWSLEDYVQDVTDVIAKMERPPILIGHSMGGMIAQIYTQTHVVPGMVLLASVPAEGLTTCAWHMMFQAPEMLMQIGMMPFFGIESVSPNVMHRTFFSDATPHEEVSHFMLLMQQESQRVTADLLQPPLIPGKCKAEHRLVVAGGKDRMVSVGGLSRTAEYYDAELIVDPVLPHGLMLDHSWQRAADHVLDWLDHIFLGEARQNGPGQNGPGHNNSGQNTSGQKAAQ